MVVGRNGRQPRGCLIALRYGRLRRQNSQATLLTILHYQYRCGAYCCRQILTIRPKDRYLVSNDEHRIAARRRHVPTQSARQVGTVQSILTMQDRAGS